MVFFEAFIWVLLFTAFMALYRAVFGPTTFDKIVAVNVIGTKTVVVLVLIGFVYQRPYFFDIALLYALLNFIATIAISKYVERGKICE
jgi:multicomponent Na+:H+ antiporter subunit F